jgi:hypothetical protein
MVGAGVGAATGPATHIGGPLMLAALPCSALDLKVGFHVPAGRSVLTDHVPCVAVPLIRAIDRATPATATLTAPAGNFPS